MLLAGLFYVYKISIQHFCGFGDWKVIKPGKQDKADFETQVKHNQIFVDKRILL